MIENTSHKKHINIYIVIISLIVSVVLLDHNINNLRKNGAGSPVFENVSIESQEKEFTSQLVEPVEIRSRVSTAYDSFVEENNLSPEIKSAFIDLLTEKEIEILDLQSESGKISDAKLRMERDYLDKYYNEKISNLLSPELFNSYRAFYR